jgi:hypothetical protein
MKIVKPKTDLWVGQMISKSVVDEIEDIFKSELGIGSKFILDQAIREMGKTRKTLKKTDVDELVAHLLRDYNKVLGVHIKIIKEEIERRFNTSKSN